MTQPSPSLLNSLQRFQFQKKLQFPTNSNPPSEGKNCSLVESSNASESLIVGSSASESVASSNSSIIRPVIINIKTPYRIGSESLTDTQTMSMVNSNGLMSYTQNVNLPDEDSSVSKAHSISDSEEEGPSQPQSIVVDDDDDDDDDIISTIPRSKIPKPIVLSDSDDDDNQNSTPSKQESQNNCSELPVKNEPKESEVFLVEDDSNSVEFIHTGGDNASAGNQLDTKQEVKPEPIVGNLGGKRKAAKDSPQSKVKRKKKKRKINSDSDEETVRGERVFDSDADSDEEISGKLTESKKKVLDFLNTATDGELRLIPSCTNKKVETINSLRPFEGWIDLVTKFQTGKHLGTNLLNGSQQVIEAREMVSNLMRRCEKIANRTEKAIAAGSHSISHQPSILNPELKLKTYQMVGLNWLNVMNSQNLSGILADEMGLGKTIQVIAFLAHLKETGQTTPNSPHLIVVPASTLENWNIEFEKWCPSLKVVQYYGSQEERRWLRNTWCKEGLKDIDVILTTYSMVGSCYEERKMFRVFELHYVVFDEAHMLKNMNTQRYENLITINALHRMLLTGTPLQNNLLELMSLLVFIMPDMFRGKEDYLKFLFTKTPKQSIEEAPLFEQEQVQRAKTIMQPFVLRRLKVDVLRDLPTKTSQVVECGMEEEQALKYAEMCEQIRNAYGRDLNSMSIMMDLRRLANHPVTLRYHYQDDTLKKMAELLAAEPSYKESDSSRVLEDLLWQSDHQLHNLVKSYDCLRGYELADSVLIKSGKFLKLDEILPSLKENGHRVLIFSQFLFILDILEDYLRVRDHSFLRLDGSTPVTERQDMIDLYNQDSSLFIFLLSTRAGGLGINLTAADTVIIHDVDFNPYNDKQAEDRCHRMGQTRPVQIMRFVSKGTIEEAIMRVAQEKLHLEKEVTSFKDDEIAEHFNVAQLLRQSLGIPEPS